MKVLIVKNTAREGPGLLEGILKLHGIGSDTVDLDEGDSFPGPRGYSAVFVLGGPDSANDATPKMQGELRRIGETVDAKIPYMGVCLGMQALVKATGGEVCRNETKEAGWRDPEGNFYAVDLTEEGKSDRLFSGMGKRLRIFELHGETVRLADGMRLLATG